MREELVRRDFSESGLRTYLGAVEAFRQWLGKRLDHAGPDDMRRYHAYLLEERKLAKNTVVTQISAFAIPLCAGVEAPQHEGGSAVSQAAQDIACRAEP